jgi:hypothetical protein
MRAAVTGYTSDRQAVTAHRVHRPEHWLAGANAVMWRVFYARALTAVTDAPQAPRVPKGRIPRAFVTRIRNSKRAGGLLGGSSSGPSRRNWKRLAHAPAEFSLGCRPHGAAICRCRTGFGCRISQGSFRWTSGVP